MRCAVSNCRNIAADAPIEPLAAAGLIDEYVLIIHPVVLGTGIRLFDGTHQAFELTRSMTTPKGVTVAHYVPVGAPEPAS